MQTGTLVHPVSSTLESREHGLPPRNGPVRPGFEPHQNRVVLGSSGLIVCGPVSVLLTPLLTEFGPKWSST